MKYTFPACISEATRRRSIMIRSISCVIALGLLGLTAAGAQSGATLDVDAGTVVSPVSPTLYGLMTEEINYSYEGGLYPELLRNSTVQHSWQGFEHWRLVERGSGRAEFKGDADGPSAALPSSMDVHLRDNGPGKQSGVSNEGFWGMAVRPESTYTGSFYAKTDSANTAHARLVADENGAVLAEASVPLQGGGWQRYRYQLKTAALSHTASSANHFELTFEQPGSVKLQLISLQSPTYQARPDGLRPDLMEKMAAMHPHFLRLPGGNYLEGDTIAERFDWKKTIGLRVDRPGHQSPWGYTSTDNLGLLEFLEWCEDLHIEPLLAVYAGYSLKGEHVVGPQLEPYVQDDLDEIEYVTGSASTKWGAQRAKDGHPAPFPLHDVEIGNEDNFDKSGSYGDRFAQIATAIRAKYPELKLIATMPINSGHPDLVDDHYYKSPEEFYAMVHFYDKADRNGPKIFVGEWATREGSPTPDFGAALGDAAWMTGMERNSDLIQMASYAPLLVNVNPGGMQWSSDLIGYDAMSSYGSPSYWAQVLFASHIGDHTVQTSATNPGERFFWSATVSQKTHILHLKLVNASGETLPLDLQLNGVKAGSATSYTLHADSDWATNSITTPDHITPKQGSVNVTPGNWQHVLPARTIEVLDIPLR